MLTQREAELAVLAGVPVEMLAIMVAVTRRGIVVRSLPSLLERARFVNPLLTSVEHISRRALPREIVELFPKVLDHPCAPVAEMLLFEIRYVSRAADGGGDEWGADVCMYPPAAEMLNGRILESATRIVSETVPLVERGCIAHAADLKPGRRRRR